MTNIDFVSISAFVISVLMSFYTCKCIVIVVILINKDKSYLLIYLFIITTASLLHYVQQNSTWERKRI